MDQVLQYQIPELHPLAVHFPLALLIAASFGALVWMARGTTFWRHATLLMLWMGTAGSFFAYFTGDSMKEQSEGTPIVDELVRLHEDAAFYTLITSTSGALVLSAFAWYSRGRDRDAIVYRIGVGLLILLAGALVAWTAHIGATMTWGV